MEERCQSRGIHCSIAPMPIYRRALAYYRPFLGQTIAAVLLTLVSILLGLVRPWPFAYIVKNVLPLSGQGAHQLAVLGYDLSGLTLASVVMLMCALMVTFHIVSGLLGLYTSCPVSCAGAGEGRWRRAPGGSDAASGAGSLALAATG